MTHSIGLPARDTFLALADNQSCDDRIYTKESKNERKNEKNERTKERNKIWYIITLTLCILLEHLCMQHVCVLTKRNTILKATNHQFSIHLDSSGIGKGLSESSEHFSYHIR